MNIILCGMPCSGKTYLGKMTAEALCLNFIDTDELIMLNYFEKHHHHATCREIVLEKGETFFRTLENEVIEGLDSKNSIIAIGSGAISLNENILHLKKIGCLVYLKTPAETILERMKNRKPISSLLDPNNIEKSFTTLLEKRLPLYETHCHYTIYTDSENVIETLKNILLKEKHHGH